MRRSRIYSLFLLAYFVSVGDGIDRITAISERFVPGAFELLSLFLTKDGELMKLLKHGCWCAKLDPDSHDDRRLGGDITVDGLDQLCKSWAHTRLCTKMMPNMCDRRTTDSTTYMVSHNRSCTENTQDTCLKSICMVDIEFVSRIAKMIETTPYLTVEQPLCNSPLESLREGSFDFRSMTNSAASQDVGVVEISSDFGRQSERQDRCNTTLQEFFEESKATETRGFGLNFETRSGNVSPDFEFQPDLPGTSEAVSGDYASQWIDSDLNAFTKSTVVIQETETPVTIPATTTRKTKPTRRTTTTQIPTTTTTTTTPTTTTTTTTTTTPTTTTTTTTKSTTTRPPTPEEKLQRSCIGRVRDLVFLVDSSGSVGKRNFAASMQFVRNVTLPMDISSQTTRVAVAQFSTFPQIEFGFQDSKLSLHEELENVQYMAGSTFTGKAIEYTVSEIFKNARAEAQPVLVVLTDGISYDDVRTPSDKFKRDMNGVIYAVGVGNAVSFQLRQIASSPWAKHMWKDRNWGMLKRINMNVTDAICTKYQ